MSISYKSIVQYCAIKDFFFKLLKNLEFKKLKKILKTTTTPFFAISPKPYISLYIIYK